MSHIYNCFALDKTLPLLKHSLFIQINMVSLHHILLLFFFLKINFTPCFKNDKGINRLYNSYFFVSEDLYTLKYFKSFFQLIKKSGFVPIILISAMQRVFMGLNIWWNIQNLSYFFICCLTSQAHKLNRGLVVVCMTFYIIVIVS